MTFIQCIRQSLLALIFAIPIALSAQIGINQDNSDPDPSAMLDVQSAEKGMLIPRMGTSARDAIFNPALGLLIFNVDDSCFNYYTGSVWVKNCGQVDRYGIAAPIIFGGNGQNTGIGVGTDSYSNRYVTGTFTGTLSLGTFSLTSTGSLDVFVCKLTPSGEVIWAMQLGGNSTTLVTGISTDATGNSHLVGRFAGTASFGGVSLTSAGSNDMFISKIDPQGQVLWAIQGGGTDDDAGYAISSDANGNSYFTGYFKGTATFGNSTFSSSGNRDLIVGKLDPSGQMLWVAREGGGQLDNGTGIAVDGAGNSIVIGNFTGTISVGNTTLISLGYMDVMVIKYDANGQILWATQAGGSNIDQGKQISVDADGNLYVVADYFGSPTWGGYSIPNNGATDALIAKLNPSGQILWVEPITGSSYEYVAGIVSDGAGNSYVIGRFLLSTDIGGQTLTSRGNNDIYVAKFDSSGQKLWAQNVGGTDHDLGYGLSLDPSNRLTITGVMSGTAIFGEDTVSTTGGEKVFVWMLDGNDGTNLESALKLSELQDEDLDPNNELQLLSLSGSNLSISDGNAVDLSGLDTDTDDQSLSLIGTQLNIDDGAGVDLSMLPGDELGSHIATQTLQLNNNWLSNDGGNEGLQVANDGALTTSGLLTIGGNIRLGGNWISNDGSNEGIRIQNDGDVGIGLSSPSHRLTVTKSGNAANNLFLISNVNNDAVSDALEIKDKDGNDYLTVQSTGFGDTDQGRVIVHGNLRIEGGTPSEGDVLTTDVNGNASWTKVSRASPIRAAKSSAVQSYNDSDTWRNVTGWTDYYQAFGDESYKLEAGITCRLTTGTNDDDFNIRVVYQCGAVITTYYSEVHEYRPDQGSSNHNNFTPVNYLDFVDIDAICTAGPIRFRLQVRNTGDDPWEVQDNVLIVTEF